VHRAVILTTLTLLLLAVTGITLAGESTIGPESGSPTEPTVQDATTATVEPTATTVWETTDVADEESTEGTEPAAGSVTEESTGPEAEESEITEEPEVAEEQAPGGRAENVGRPEGVGKARGFGGKAEGGGQANDDGGEARGGEAQEKVPLCHKDKKTITVGAPAQAAHERHGDTVGPCQTEGAVPGPSGATTGPEAAKNGGGNGQPKVTLCHKGKTLTVGAPAQAAHLRHGDTEGPCA
jgi:hypothetical protein